MTTLSMFQHPDRGVSQELGGGGGGEVVVKAGENGAVVTGDNFPNR